MEKAQINAILAAHPADHLLEIFTDGLPNKINLVDYKIEFMDADELLKVTVLRNNIVVFLPYSVIFYMSFLPNAITDPDDLKTARRTWLINYNHMGT